MQSVDIIAAAGCGGTCNADDGGHDAEHDGSLSAEYGVSHDAEYEGRDTMQSKDADHEAQSNGCNSNGSNEGWFQSQMPSFHIQRQRSGARSILQVPRSSNFM